MRQSKSTQRHVHVLYLVPAGKQNDMNYINVHIETYSLTKFHQQIFNSF